MSADEENELRLEKAATEKRFAAIEARLAQLEGPTLEETIDEIAAEEPVLTITDPTVENDPVTGPTSDIPPVSGGHAPE